MRRNLLAFLSLALVATLALAGCNGGGGGTTNGNRGEEIGTVSVMGLWGTGELDAFEEVVAGWESETGGQMNFEGTRDLSAVLRARVSGGNPPDVAILPNPALMTEFAQADELVSLDEFIDQSTFDENYAETWRDLGSVDGKLYGMFVKTSTKSTVWYDPKTFQAGSYTIPTTWDELVTLADKMKADGKAPPWSIAVEGGAASGWPGTDWIQEILLTESGPDVYDKWTNHEIPWTDPAIKSAWEKFGQMATTEGYVVGGVPTILSTNFEAGAYPPFQDPATAHMYFLGAFTQGFISKQFPDLKPVDDYDFFKFVQIKEPGTATGSGDILVAFNDSATTRSFVEYLANGENWESWAKAGGYTTPNKQLDPATYPDELARKAAAQLTDSETFRFDADDLMPAELQTAYFGSILKYLQKPGDLDKILADLEQVAAGAYQ